MKHFLFYPFPLTQVIRFHLCFVAEMPDAKKTNLDELSQDCDSNDSELGENSKKSSDLRSEKCDTLGSVNKQCEDEGRKHSQSDASLNDSCVSSRTVDDSGFHSQLSVSEPLSDSVTSSKHLDKDSSSLNLDEDSSSANLDNDSPSKNIDTITSEILMGKGVIDSTLDNKVASKVVGLGDGITEIVKECLVEGSEDSRDSFSVSPGDELDLSGIDDEEINRVS